MATPRICVLRAPGTNCDLETAHAFELAGGRADRLHLFRLLECPRQLLDFQILCIPGGFSYGDDVGAGVVFGSQLRGHLGQALREFLQADRLVLGICNGFQTLMRSGILPGGFQSQATESAEQRPEATLTWNRNGRYTACWVTLSVGPTQNVFLRGMEQVELPIAHAEGRLAVTDDAVLTRWQQNGQIALQYTEGSAARDVTAASRPVLDAVRPFPANPNGSVANIAGLGDPTGRILGLMPHPERFIHATQHPQWTRQRSSGEGAGLELFRNGVQYFA